MLVILVAFSGIVGAVAMPTLAAILIVAAIGSLRIGQIEAILRTSVTSRIAMIATFVATLILSIPEAVAVGLIISLLLQLNQEAIDLRVVELTPREGGGFDERPAPSTLTSHSVTILDVYGSLFYAGARTLQARLPAIGGAVEPVVVLRLRGRTALGATAFKVFADYSAALRAVEGKLYLSGVDPALVEQFERAGHVQTGGPVGIIEATPHLGESSLAAYADAQAWLIEHHAPNERHHEPAPQTSEPRPNAIGAWFKRLFGKD
jgi:SulP family sulfate permease